MKKQRLIGDRLVDFARHTKQVVGARSASGECATHWLGSLVNLDASSRWPVTPCIDEAWSVLAEYSQLGRYDAMGFQLLQVPVSPCELDRLDSNAEESRRTPEPAW